MTMTLGNFEVIDTKMHIVSDDRWSGKVVVVMETRNEVVDTHVATDYELDAAKYLYREIPVKLETKIGYLVSAYYHFENGRSANNLLGQWHTWEKNEAERLFENEIDYLK